MWQKFIAGAFVMTGSLGFGWSFCREMSREIWHLRTQKQILLYMIGEISYLHRPMEEIMDIVSEKVEAPYDSFLAHISKKIQERSGKGLAVLWQEGIDAMRDTADISKTALAYFQRMGSCFGCEGDWHQVEQLRLFEHEIDLAVEHALAKKEENSRLVKTLSALTGILCIVLFL